MADEDQPSADAEPNEDEVADPEPPPPFTLTVSVKVRVARALPRPTAGPTFRIRARPTARAASRGRRLIPPSPAPPAQSLTRLVADSPRPRFPTARTRPSPLLPSPSASVLFPGEEAPTSFDPAVPSDDGSVVFDGVEASFEREPGAALVTQLVNNPLVITVHRGETKLATRTVDLTPFARGGLPRAARPTPSRPFPSQSPIPPPTAGSPRAAPGQSSPPRRHHARHRRALGDVRLPRGRRGRPRDDFRGDASVSRARDARGGLRRTRRRLPVRVHRRFPARRGGTRVVRGGRPRGGAARIEPRRRRRRTAGTSPSGARDPPPPARDAATKVWMPKRTVDALVSRVKRRGPAVPLEIARYCSPRAARAIPCTPTTTRRAPPRWTVCWTRVASSSEGVRAASSRPRSAILRPSRARGRGREAGDGGSGPARGVVGGGGGVPPAPLAFPPDDVRSVGARWRPPPPTEVTVADLLPHVRAPVEPHVPKDEAAERYRTEVLSAASTGV